MFVALIRAHRDAELFCDLSLREIVRFASDPDLFSYRFHITTTLVQSSSGKDVRSLPLFLISYNLKKESSYDYHTLHNTIRNLGQACRLLDSTWLLNTSQSAHSVAALLLAVYGSESLIVSHLDPRADVEGYLPQEQRDCLISAMREERV